MHAVSLEPKLWKPADTGGNGVVTQRDFGGVAPVALHVLDAALIARCTFSGSLAECLRHDGREDQEVARAIHVSKGYLSKLLRSVWAAQVTRLIRFMRETRCAAPLQKIADEMGFELRPKKSELEMRAEAAEREAAALRAQVAASRASA
jgi:hypothetical protein